jgi:PAS domain S-box-containing protein
MQLEPTANVLLVDDHPENLIALEAILGGLGQNLVRANSGEEALRCLLHQDFAVILLDVQMPNMDGFEAASLIRQRPRSRSTPIIFLTAFNTDDNLMVRGYALGAVDYLFKPINPAILTSKVNVFVELFRKTAEIERQANQLALVNSELKRSEERFRLLSRCSPIGIFLMDTVGQYTYANPSCQAICGFTVQENWQTDWTNSIHTDEREQVLRNWSDCIRQGQAYSEEFRIETLGATKWVHVRTSPMLSDWGELLGHVGTIEDITDRKQSEVTRDQIIREQAARQQAEAANRMKDEFLAIVSHELRTPLNSILGWSQLLQNRNLDASTTSRALKIIERNARSQAQLIEDILDVSQIIRGKLRLTMQPVSLIPVLESLIETMRPSANDKQIQILTEFNPDIDKIYGDAERIKQIIWNLLSNAIKFTPDQGKVTVRLTCVNGAESANQHRTRTSMLPFYEAQSDAASETTGTTGYAQIQVVDTGIGIDAEFLPYVFDRFRQADSTTTRSYNGLGLGLAIVYHLVEQHQGMIWAASEGEGKGATFTLNLPLLTNSMLSAPPDADRLNHSNIMPSLHAVQVLVVEDHEDTREFITTVLQQFGAEVMAVSSVPEAIRYLEQTCPDVLVSDIGMPMEDGYELIHQVRNRESDHKTHIPAIALTAYVRTEDQSKALDAGFETHLSKPVEAETLVKVVAKAVGRYTSEL